MTVFNIFILCNYKVLMHPQFDNKKSKKYDPVNKFISGVPSN